MLYRERLYAPWSWWLIGFGIGVPTITAVAFLVDPWVSLGAGLVTATAITFMIGWFGSTEIVVDADGVRVGRSLLGWPWVGSVEVLDAEASARLLGVDADVRAHTVQRPWLKEGIRVEVADAADPHPYWYVSSRTPAQCAAAIAKARAGAPQGDTAQGRLRGPASLPAESTEGIQQ